MLIITPRGFYNVVLHDEDPTVVIVRARVYEDLRRLQPVTPIRSCLPFQIQRTPERDYPYRVALTKEAWEKTAATLASEIDYTSFYYANLERNGEMRAAITKSATFELMQLEACDDRS